MAAPLRHQPLDRPIRPRARSAAEAAEAGTVEIVHGTVVHWHGRGILLLGPSGSGKSDLALRLIDRGAALVADDLVRISARDGRLVARAEAGPGLIELRGQGIFRLPHLAAATLEFALALDPATAAAADRLPPAASRSIAGIALPCFRLDPGTASATARIAVLLQQERVY